MKKVLLAVILVVIVGFIVWWQLGRGIFRDNGSVTIGILPADNEFPAAGTCVEAGNEDIIRVNVNIDVPLPRCQKVVAGKK